MKVLFTHPFFLPYVSRGAEVEIRDVGTQLRQNGIDVRLLTSKPSRWSRPPKRVEGLPVEYVYQRLTQAHASAGLDEAALFNRTVASRFPEDDAQLVHCWHYADAAGAAGRRPGVPMILKLTGTVIPERIRTRNPRQHDLLMRAIQTADEVWCNSEYARTAMLGFGIPMRVVPAGVRFDPGPLTARESFPVALVAAAPDDPRKRVEEVIDAWPAVLAAIPQARLWIAGEASRITVDTLRDRVPADVRASITFFGTLSREALARRYQQAWVVLAPGVHEALGLVTLEALASGTRVIGARSGATTELLAGAGVLVEPQDVTGWSAAIVDELSNAPLPRLKQAMEAAAPYRWERILPIYLERYSALVSGDQT